MYLYIIYSSSEKSSGLDFQIEKEENKYTERERNVKPVHFCSAVKSALTFFKKHFVFHKLYDTKIRIERLIHGHKEFSGFEIHVDQRMKRSLSEEFWTKYIYIPQFQYYMWHCLI